MKDQAEMLRKIIQNKNDAKALTTAIKTEPE